MPTIKDHKDTREGLGSEVNGKLAESCAVKGWRAQYFWQNCVECYCKFHKGRNEQTPLMWQHIELWDLITTGCVAVVWGCWSQPFRDNWGHNGSRNVKTTCTNDRKTQQEMEALGSGKWQILKSIIDTRALCMLSRIILQRSHKLLKQNKGLTRERMGREWNPESRGRELPVTGGGRCLQHKRNKDKDDEYN